MKKVLSFLLSFLFFIEVLPLHALAEETVENPGQFYQGYQDNGISDQEIKAAVALAGLEDNAPQWHDGMTAENCTNAAQLLEVLKDFVYNRLDGVLDVFQDYDTLQNSGRLDLNGSGFDDMYGKALNLRDEVYYYMDVLEENSRQISYLNLLMQDEDIDEEELISYSYEIDEYYSELKNAFDEVRKSISLWENDSYAWDMILCGETGDFQSYAEKYAEVMRGSESLTASGGPILLATEKEVVPAKGNRIIDRLSPVTSALADTRQKMEITVVDDRSFIVRTKEKGTNVSGAQITLRDVNKDGKRTNKKERSQTTNARGAIVGLIRDFSPDRDGFVNLDIEIRKNGYRSLLLRRVEIKKGNTFNVSLEKDDGTPYVIEASYNGSDMMNNRYDLIVTELSDTTDEITLTTFGKKDYTIDLYCVKDGKKSMLASNIQVKSGKETKTSLKKKFVKSIPADSKVFVDLKYDGKYKTVQLQLKPIKAVVDEPMNLPGLASVFNKNITLTLPESFPGLLSKMKVTIDIPLVDKWPFNAMLLPNGMAFVMVGFHKGKNALNMKNDHAKIMAKMVKVVEEEGWRRVQEIKSGGASDFKLPVWRLASLQLDWCIMGYAIGQLTSVKGRDDVRVLRLAGNVGVNAKMQGDYQCIVFGVFTIGVTGTLNAVATLGLGLNLYYANSGKNWKFKSWELSKSNSGITILVRLEIGVFAGVGYKGVASVTITGYGFLELVCRLGGTRSFTLTGGFGARLTAQFFFVKAVKQLGDEIKWQLLPTFKRLSSLQPGPLERFVQMFNPPVAMADAKNKAPDVVNAPAFNEKLTLKTDSTYTLSNVQDDSISVVRVKSADNQSVKGDYAFYLSKNPQTSKINLYYRDLNKSSRAPSSVLEMIRDFKVRNGERFLEKDNLTFDNVMKWDVVGYNVEVAPMPSSPPTSQGYPTSWDNLDKLIVITLLMAESYNEITLSDGSKDRLPAKTAAIVATFIHSNKNDKGIQMTDFGYYASAACVFMVADSQDAPVCHPVTDTESITRGDGNLFPNQFQESHWIHLTCSPARLSKANTVKSFTIRLDVCRRNNNAQITGDVVSLPLGSGNDQINNYLFERVRPGAQYIVKTPYYSEKENTKIVVQDHWYSLAAKKQDSDDRYLVVNFHSDNKRAGTGLYELDKDPVLDFCVYKQQHFQSKGSRALGHEFLVYLTKGESNSKNGTSKMNRIRGGRVVVTEKRIDNKPYYEQNLYWADMIDFDVPASTGQVHVSYIYNTPLVWWVEALAADPKDSKKVTWLIRASWIDEEPSSYRMSKPMTLAVIPGQSDNGTIRGPVFFELLEGEMDKNKGITGIYGIKYGDNSDSYRVELHKFFFKLTAGIDLVSSTFTKEIATAGSYDDIQLAVHNNGNVPVSRVDLGIYYNNNKLQEIQVNLEHDNLSKAIFYDNNGKEKRRIQNETSKLKAVRVVSSNFSKNADDRWSVRQWRIQPSRSESVSRSQNATTLSMPDSYDTLIIPMQIPHNWVGDYNIEIRVDKIYCRNKLNFQVKRPPTKKASLSPVDRMFTLSSAIADDSESNLGDLVMFTPGGNGEAVIKKLGNDLDSSGTVTELDDKTLAMFSSNITFDRLLLDTEAKDIELNAYVWVDDDVEMVTIYLNENALITGNPIVLRAFTDENKTPSFEWTFDGDDPSFQGLRMKDGNGWSLDLPLAMLTGGEDAYSLLIEVDSGSENEALFSNNFTFLTLDSQPMTIVTEPDDRTENAGANTTFTVEVTGGRKPYSYQWQVLLPGGKWEDIPDAWESRLTLYGVYASLDGAQYRCLIEDDSGRLLISRAATLTVLSSDPNLPPTGDAQNLILWLVLFSLSIAAVAVFLTVKRRKR